MKPLYSNEKHHHARFTWVWNFQNICTIARTKSIHTNDTEYFVLFLLNLLIWVLNECPQEIFNCMLQFGSLLCVDYKRMNEIVIVKKIVFMKSSPLSNSWRNMRSDHIRSRTSLLVEVDVSDFSGIPDARHRKRGRNNTKGMIFIVSLGKFHAAVEKQSY